MIVHYDLFQIVSHKKKSAKTFFISTIAMPLKSNTLFFDYTLKIEIISIYLQSLKEGRNNKLKKWQIINHR
jgi:hypothetical protein